MILKIAKGRKIKIYEKYIKNNIWPTDMNNNKLDSQLPYPTNVFS